MLKNCFFVNGLFLLGAYRVERCGLLKRFFQSESAAAYVAYEVLKDTIMNWTKEIVTEVSPVCLVGFLDDVCNFVRFCSVWHVAFFIFSPTEELLGLTSDKAIFEPKFERFFFQINFIFAGL